VLSEYSVTVRSDLSKQNFVTESATSGCDMKEYSIS